MNATEQWLLDHNIQLNDKFTKQTDPHNMECLTCGHQFTTRPSTLIQNIKKKNRTGCPRCDDKIKKQQRQQKKQSIPNVLQKENKIKLSETYTKFTNKHKMQCLVCGHQFEKTCSTVRQAYRDSNGKYTGCPKCSEQIQQQSIAPSNIPHLLETENKIKLLESYHNGGTVNHKMQCLVCGDQFERRPTIIRQRYKETGNLGCPQCTINQRPSFVDNMRKNNNIQILEPYKTRTDSHNMECLTCGYKFNRIPSVIVSSSNKRNLTGCPKCDEKIVQQRQKQKLKQSKIPQLLLEQNKIKLLEEYKGAKRHHVMQCLVCEHQWEATPMSKLQTYKKYQVSGCPLCNDTKKHQSLEQTNKNQLELLRKRGIEVLEKFTCSVYDTTVPVRAKNHNCGHEFTANIGNLTNGVSCPICGKEERTRKMVEASKARSVEWRKTASTWNVYKSKVRGFTDESYRKHKDKINPNNLPRGLAGKSGVYHLDHIVSKRFCFEHGIPPEICGSCENLQMLPWLDNMKKHAHIIKVPNIIQQHLQNFYNRTLEFFDDDILNNFEQMVMVGNYFATLYNEQLKFIVLVIPLSEQMADSQLANRAKKYWDDNGIRNFIIYEDELWLKRDIVNSKLRHLLQLNDSKRIHGRKCEIRQIDSKTKNQFMNAFHIQGADVARLAYGAFYEDQLIAVMTFSPPNVSKGGRRYKQHMWELSRFATNANYRVPGIAGKLLSHFKKNNRWDEIYSFADRRWSYGNVYNQLEFDVTRINKPSYFYIINGIRKHRWNYRKDALKNTLPEYDPSLTEYENMINAGHWRIWDCGTIRFHQYNNC